MVREKNLLATKIGEHESARIASRSSKKTTTNDKLRPRTRRRCSKRGSIACAEQIPNGEWEHLEDIRLINIVFGAARNWLRDHEPSIRLAALLPDYECCELHQGEYPNTDELFADRSWNPGELDDSRIDLLSVLRHFSCEELFFLFARWFDFEHEEIAQLVGM